MKKNTKVETSKTIEAVEIKGTVYSEVFYINDSFILTSVVVDQEEFDELCNILEELHVMLVSKDALVCNSSIRAAKSDIDRIRKACHLPLIQRIRKACHLPLIQRGTKTQIIFDRYNVKTDKLSVIVRGKGANIARRCLNMENQCQY